MKKVTFIIPLLFAGIVSTAQNVSEDSQVSGNGEVTVFSREEILARIAENRLNNAAANSNDSTTSNIASGRLTATGDEGITTLETETSGSGSLEATFNGETVAQEPSTAVPNVESVAPDDSPVSGNGGVTIFSREEILARFAQNRQNDEPTVSTGSTGPSFATANVTSTAGEGITELETETSGNATLIVTSNGETIVEEPAAAAPAEPVASNDTPTSTNTTSARLTATADEGITSLETSGGGSIVATFNGETVAQQPAAAPVEEEATDDSQNGGVTVFSREEILARIEANRQNNEPTVSTGSTGPSIATANVTSTAGEGITELETETSGNATLTVTSNGEIIVEEPAAAAPAAPVASNDTPTSTNIASGRLTATGSEGITSLETETSGNGSLEATFNGETVAQESTAAPVAETVEEEASDDSQNGGVTVFSREEILARVEANRQNDEPAVSTGSTGPSIATANVTSTAGEGITELETETSGNATLTVTSNGETIVEEPAAAAPAAPVTSNDTPTSTNIASGRLTATGSEGITSLETETSGNGSLEATFNGETVAQEPTVAPVAETVEEEATDDSQNGGVTVFSREEILARVEANRQNDEPAVSTGSTGPSIATANVTSTAGEGITELETETSGNATLTVVSNGETIVEEEAPTLQVATPQVEREAVRVRLFPNPVRRSLVVLTPRAQFSRVEISSPNGELVKSENINNLSRARLDVSDLQQGLYFISIYSNGGRTVERFFKR